MTQATTKDYWISPSALHIERNALSNPDYIQASCTSGAQILVYVKDIIGYDDGHNYRRWPLQASPTVFNSHSEKYVYAAIPRNLNSAASAWIVFPSELIDIYGKNEAEEQIGDEKYYYIFLQGKLTSSGDNGTLLRDWDPRIVTGYLSSDEATAAIAEETEWYKYASVDGVVTFLKDITMKAGQKFRELYAKSLMIWSGGELSFQGQTGKLTGIVDTKTDVTAEDKIVTPSFMSEKSLSRIKDDKAYGVINFLKGVLVNSESSINEFGDAFLRSLQGKGFSVSELGEAILKTLRSADYDTAAQAGFGLMTRTDGKYKLSLTDLEVWGKAIFHELEIRKLSYSGGNYIFSPAGSTLMHVKEVRNQKGELLGWNCFFLADDGETATENLWKAGDLARCQSFNIKAGVYENVANKYYWREVVSVSKENVQITDDDGNVLYDGKKFGRVSLSATSYDKGSTDIPAAGDTIVCLGNSTVTERQNAIIISTVGEEAPSFVQYCGINDFTLQGKDVIVLSPKGNRLTGSFYSSAVGGELGSVLKQTMEGLASEVSKRESDISSVRAEIKQSADAISLKVEQTAEKDRNLLPNSYFQIGSRIFGVCHRKVMLEKGKSYALTLWGRIDPFMTVTDSNGLSKLVANTHKMRAHIWTENASGTWTYDPYAEIGADNETGYATVKFNDVPATGEYSFGIFPDVEINETNGEYMFYATCAQIEEIPNMQANGTAWSLGKKDPAIYGNLLPRLGGWTFGKNCILRPNEAEVEGHRLDVAGGANQSNTAGLDIIRLDGITLASGETYTLSFWARGKGKFQTYLFNGSVDVCSYAIRDDGAFGLLKDGSIEPQRTLTMEWTRYSVTFSIKTGGAANVIPVRLAKGGSVNICGVKLEPFGRLTDFTDQNVTVEELKATGIYITERKVNVIADNFQIKNRRNEETFAVDADGWVTMNHIAIGGMINKQGVVVNGLTAFNTLFDSSTDALKICWYTVPKFNNMYGIYYFTAPTGKNTDGKVPVRIHMPSAYVYQDGSSYYVSGDVYDENDRMDMNLLRSVRAMVGNTVMIYNDSSEDIQIEGKSCYFVDEFKPMNYASAKSATTALKAPSVGLVTPDTNVGDMSNALDKPLVNDDDGGVKPNQRYYGRRRDDLLITLKGGEHRFVCMTCVCEVNIYGWENIYWLVNYGQGLNTN